MLESWWFFQNANKTAAASAEKGLAMLPSHWTGKSGYAHLHHLEKNVGGSSGSSNNSSNEGEDHLHHSVSSNEGEDHLHHSVSSNMSSNKNSNSNSKSHLLSPTSLFSDHASPARRRSTPELLLTAQARRHCFSRRNLMVAASFCFLFMMYGVVSDRRTDGSKGVYRENASSSGASLVKWWNSIPRPSNTAELLPKAVYGREETFSEYLDARWPRPPVSERASTTIASSTKVDEDDVTIPHIWLTMADETWARSGVAAMSVFVNQLNRERLAVQTENSWYSRRKIARETILITLCLDEECVRVCEERGVHAYGGFQYNRPDPGQSRFQYENREIVNPNLFVGNVFSSRPSTWPKIAGLIEILQHRDTFFVDADVAFKWDPYPYMESYFKTHDLIAQENDSYDHINTGWFWMRRGEKSVEAWRQVLEMDMIEISRDQRNFNQVLGTAELRLWEDGNERPLRQDFISRNGLRVHILDASRFWSYHFEIDRPNAELQSVYIHMTCGDDVRTKVYVAKSEGFWSDVDGYYSEPSPIVTVDHMGGTLEEVQSMMRILLTVAHYLGRTIVPPEYMFFKGLQPPQEGFDHEVRIARHAYSAFPLPHISDALGIQIVEPAYINYATRHLAGGSVLNSSSLTDPEQRLMMDDEAQRRIARVHDFVDVDLRSTPTLASLIKLVRRTEYSNRFVIRLVHFDLPNTNWRTWTIPDPVKRITPCYMIQEMPYCDHICRWEKGDPKAFRLEELVPVEGNWPDF